MCMATQPAPVAAATSQSEAEMSLTRLAPAATAASATSGLTVSTDTRTPRSAAGPEALSASTTGHHPRQLDVAGYGLGPGPRRLPAHVDHVGALGHHLEPAGHRGVEGVVEPAVGEGVRRDVEDAHDERPPGTAGRPRQGQ